MALKYPTTSKTLLERMNDGDQICWNEFYFRYGPIVIAVARHWGINASEAEDICQQVMTQFFKQSRTFKFDSSKAHFRTYFSRIVNSKIIDFLKKKPDVPVEVIAEQPQDPETDRIFQMEWLEGLKRDADDMLKNIVSPETFQAFDLCVRQGRDPQAVAGFLNRPVDFVYTAKSRCIAHLKDIKKKLIEQDPELRQELEEDDA